MKLPKSCIETKKYFCFMNETICSNAGVGRDQPCVWRDADCGSRRWQNLLRPWRNPTPLDGEKYLQFESGK